MPKACRILFLDGQADQIVNFRETLLKLMVARGHKVTATADHGNDVVTAILESWGVAFEPVTLARAGMNLLGDLVTLVSLVRLLARLKPDVILARSVKPVIYGLLAARMTGIPHRFAMLTGLGYALTDGTELRRVLARRVVLTMMRLSLRYAEKLIVQNPDDVAFFLECQVLRDPKKISRVYGSGVDLEHFSPVPFPTIAGGLTFLMIARLLRDKGVNEYVEAARLVKRRHPSSRFILLGAFDSNPTAVRPQQVENWVREGFIEYHGPVADVRPHIGQCHVYVLPSYREGTPRTVLEAMAMGRPIITTNAPGCRETVIEGRNGILVPVREVAALAKAMEFYILNCDRLVDAGIESRKIAMERFDASAVSAHILNIMGITDGT